MSAPQPGSLHYFTDLYAPPAIRPVLRTAHVLAAEIRASLRTDLDHRVAHARLEWWEQEAGRTAAGAPSHPLLPPLLAHGAGAATAATLADWVLAARIELAGGIADTSSAAEYARRSGGAGFALYAALLRADADAARALGTGVAGLQAPLARPRPGADRPATAPARAATLAALGAIAAGSQPALRPLLVWSALALRRAARGEFTPPHAPLAAPRSLLGDNFHAWRVARAADAGRIHRLF